MEAHQVFALAVCVFAVFQPSEAIRRAALVLFSNAVLLSAVKIATGYESPLLNTILDTLSGFIILWGRAGIMQLLLGMTFVVQIGSHVAISINPLGDLVYWEWINRIFISQAVLLAVWSSGDGGRLAFCRDWIALRWRARRANRDFGRPAPRNGRRG